MHPDPTRRPRGGTATPVPSRRRWPAVTATVLLVVAAGWVLLWFHIADLVKSNIVAWATERRPDGWAVEWRLLSVSGFPVRWDANIIGARAKRTGAEPQWFWRGPERLTLHYRPWSPRTFELAAPGRHIFGPDDATPETTVTVTARMVDGRLTLDDEGEIDQLSLALDAASASMDEAAPVRIRSLRASLGAGATDPSAPPHRQVTARLVVDVVGITLPPDLRPVLGHVIGRASLTASLLGRFPSEELEDALVGWRDGGGTVEVARLGLGWGPLTIDGDGTVALDADLQPQAALSARIAGYGETVDALVRAGMIRPQPAFIAKMALGALARTPQGGGPPEIQVPLTIQQRQLYVGPVALFVLPPIDWSGF